MKSETRKKDEISVIVGEKIRNIRKEKDYSQEKFAEFVGVHRTYMGCVERGEKNITLVTMQKITKALELTLEEFFRGI